MNHDGRGLFGAIITIVSMLTLVSSASAATFTVANTNDAGPGSLRDAITQANNAGGPDVIDATHLSTGTINLQTALPDVTSGVVIEGPGAGVLTVRRDPTSGIDFGVLHFEGPAVSTVSGLTVADGATDLGGGIYTDDTLTLDQVVVTNNSASNSGGGIYTQAGDLTVRDSTISTNSAPGFSGGGLYSDGSTVDIERSTISANTSTSGDGGGITLRGTGPMTINDSTIAGNSAAGFGGGVLMNAPGASLSLSNSTVAANSAPNASNLKLLNGNSVTVTSSILSAPTGGQNCADSTGNGFTSGGFNIASDMSCALNQSTDQRPANPDLGPLQDNGGLTFTMAPSAASPAIDQGTFGADLRDQRGLDRSVDMPGAANAGTGTLGVDVGAVEVQTSEVPLPTATITSGPTVSRTPPTFDFTAADASVVECSIDQGTPAYGPCTTANSHTAASPLADGTWTFRVRAVAITGAEAVDSRSFVVDTQAPVVSVDSGPVGPNGDTTPTFSYSALEPSTFLCRLYQQGTAPPAFAACSGPGQSHTPASALADGAYTFEVQATDTGGNLGTASRSFTVDGTAPSVSVTSGPTGPTSNTTPTFGFSGAGAASFACRIVPDGGSAPAFAACAGPGQTHAPESALADGRYTFEVRGTDAAGNSGTASRSFTVDTTAPTVAVDSGPSGQTLDTTPTFSFSANEPATFQCRLSAGDFGTCSGPGQSESPAQLADGRYTLEVRATDAAGNQATASRSFDLTAAACRAALNGVIQANAAVATAQAKLQRAKASGNTAAIKKAKKAVKKAKHKASSVRAAVNQACVTSDG